MEKIATVVSDKLIWRHSVIEYEGALWIVTGWLFHQTRSVKRPIRLIRMTGLPYEAIPSAGGADYIVTQPIPKSVLLGHTPPEQASGFVVLDDPNIELVVSDAATVINPE